MSEQDKVTTPKDTAQRNRWRALIAGCLEIKARFEGTFVTLAKILNTPVLLPLIGGLTFVVVFHFAYSGVDDDLYQARDDGVITLSHARNLVEYGFIGVNPSGGRVEGYSAPVQFFLFAAVYAVTGTGYAAYATAQTVVATFLLGALFILFFRKRKVPSLILTGLAALLLAYARPFIEWHGSGMENAITHVLFLATVLTLVSFVRMERIIYPLSCVVFLATISRIESIFHVGPLLVVFGVFWLLALRDWRGIRFAFVVLGLWALFQVWRYHYFGELLPNTAHAQGISVFDNLRPWLRLDVDHMQRAATRARDMLEVHGGIVLLLALPATLVVSRRRETVLLLLLIGTLVLTAALNESVFGRDRIDPNRTTTHVAVFSALGSALLLFACLDNRRRALWAAPALGLVVVVVFGMNVVPPYHLGWSTASFEIHRDKFADIAAAEDLPRATVANPDLGAMSYHKQFNIVDLGRIGSPIMARTSGPVRADYLFDFAAPDIIESHSAWSCGYDGELFSDPRFEKRYQPVETWVTDWTRKWCTSNPESQSGFWIRSAILKSSESAERQLIDRMAADPSAERLRDELAKCQAIEDPDYQNCVYVARTAWRFLPELRKQRQVDALDDIFSSSLSAAFDRSLINGHRDGQAHRDAVEFIWDNYLREITDRQPTVSSEFDVYLDGEELIYVKRGCSEEAVTLPFFVHLMPVDRSDLPEHRKQYKFDNLDFRFEDAGGVREGDVCAVTRRLPDYEIAEVRTGQYVSGGEQTWKVKFQPGQTPPVRSLLDRIEALDGPIISSEFDVYLDGKELIYVKRGCSEEAVALPFFVHLTPVDRSDLPEHRKQYKFDNLDFRFEDAGGVREGDVCAVTRELPDYEIAEITTGQYVSGGEQTWRVAFSTGGTPPQPQQIATAAAQHVGTVSEQRETEEVVGIDSLVERIEALGGPVVSSEFDVYLDGKELIYVKRGCSEEAVTLPFFVHLMPVDRSDLPEHRKQYKFDNLDFRFEDAGGVREGDVCAVTRRLPDYEIAEVRTGQYVSGGEQTWKVKFQPGQTPPVRSLLDRIEALDGPIISSEFDVYLDGKELIYVKRGCSEEAVALPFFVHLTPVDRSDLPEHRKQYKFDNLDFRFEDAGGVREGDVCAVTRELPDYEIAEITTGQYVSGGEQTWRVAFSTGGTPPQPQQIATAAAQHVGTVSEQRETEEVVGIDSLVERIEALGGPVVSSEFDVYLDGKELIYVKRQCSEADVTLPFFVHLTPVDRSDLPEHRKQYKFDNLDFSFAKIGGIREGDACVVTRTLPDYDIVEVRTGQYRKVDGGWEHPWKGAFATP